VPREEKEIQGKRDLMAWTQGGKTVSTGSLITASIYNTDTITSLKYRVHEIERYQTPPPHPEICDWCAQGLKFIEDPVYLDTCDRCGAPPDTWIWKHIHQEDPDPTPNPPPTGALQIDSFDFQSDLIDVTAFGDPGPVYIPGIKDTLQITGPLTESSHDLLGSQVGETVNLDVEMGDTKLEGEYIMESFTIDHRNHRRNSFDYTANLIPINQKPAWTISDATSKLRETTKLGQ